MALTVSNDAQDFLGTTYGITTNQAIVDMREEIAELEPDTSPWMTLLMHPDFAGRAAQSVKIEFLEHEHLPITSTFTTNDSGSGTATSVTVATGTGVYFRPQDTARIEQTGEIVYVSARSTDTLTIVRGIGNSGTGVDWGEAAATINITRIGNASTQAGTLPEIRMVNTVAQFNYTEIERTPFGMARSASATKQYGGDPLARERVTAAAYHKRAQEEKFFWGKRDIKQTNSRPQTFCGGMAYYVTANITTVSGNLTAANLATYSRDFFRYGSHQKFLFCAPIITEAIAQFSIGKTALSTWAEGEQKYGIKANKFVNGAGDELIIINKRNWRAAERPTASPGAGGTGFIVDMDVVARRAFAGADSMYIEDRQAPDYDGKKNEFLTEASIEICHGGSGGSGQGRHGIIRGVTGYA